MIRLMDGCPVPRLLLNFQKHDQTQYRTVKALYLIQQS
jgi:hypothetical protein